MYMRQDATVDKAEDGRAGKVCRLRLFTTLFSSLTATRHNSINLAYLTTCLTLCNERPRRLAILHASTPHNMAYIETPRTDAGNATYMTNGHDFENFSVEPSLLSPLKRKEDIVSQMRNGRGISLKTPRARVPLADRRNLPGRTEFTPLLQSVARKKLERNGKLGGAPETPAFLKASYQGSDSPALPGGDVSGVYGSDLGSSVLDGEGTPMPQVASSSAQSTPLAVLPKRDAAGVLTDQGNMMTLREQENVSVIANFKDHQMLTLSIDHQQNREGEFRSQVEDTLP